METNRQPSTHTPGPWKTGSTERSEAATVVYSEHPHSHVLTYVADCNTGHGSIQTAKANARLIAAAPQMLALLRIVANEAGVSRKDVETARALLAQIDGGAR